MGRGKSSLLLGGKTFLQRVIEAARGLEATVEIIDQDITPGLGPLGGVATAFERHRFAAAVFLSCDMPFVSAGLLRKLVGQSDNGSRAVFAGRKGRLGFPFLLPTKARGEARQLIEAGEHSLQALGRAVKAKVFQPENAEELFNVNTPDDYEEAKRRWAEQRARPCVLEVRDLVVRRGEVRLVDDFSWKIAPGEHWVVLGANGCGKTSLFAALLGYLTPTRGDVFVLGEEYGDADWPTLRQKIGLVSSSIRQLMPEHEPAWITVASGKYAMIDYWGMPKKRDKAAALRLLRGIECAHLAERPWAYLSQGERQRVLIGRALMARPTLLILDEPCAGLDPAAREHFLQFLERLGRSKKAPSLVLVTHHVEEIMPVFTHALLMKAGRKLAEGPIPKTVTSRLLTEAFGPAIRLKKSGGRFALRVAPNARLIV